MPESMDAMQTKDMQTKDTHTTSEKAAARLREIAKYIDANAESLAGEFDEVLVSVGGFRVSFVIDNVSTSLQTIEITKEYIVR